jgi:hypothetical protein
MSGLLLLKYVTSILTVGIGFIGSWFFEFRDFMESIIRSHLDEIIKEKLFEKLEADPDDFEHIRALNEGWKPKPKMHFQGG